jgi:saccharopine dehydrogenase-like NADP-dependent oxidoreductase
MFALKQTVESTNPMHGNIPAAHSILCQQLNVHDINALRKVLNEIKPVVVIHTAGPFQGENYGIARVCAESSCHYLDLADDRAYVCNFGDEEANGGLGSLAKEHGVALLAGCSTTPALTTAVIDAFAESHFTTSNITDTLGTNLQHIDIALSPGNKLPRGTATISSVVSYCGKDFTMTQDG